MFSVLFFLLSMDSLVNKLDSQFRSIMGVAVGRGGARHVVWAGLDYLPTLLMECMVDMKRTIAAALLIVCQLQTCRLY